MANVELSNEETAVFQNADFLLTKNVIFQKMQKALGEIANEYQKIVEKGNVNVLIVNTSPKISKGEQYEGLPYLMLDYPRIFSQTDTLAIRSFFWWGKYFSISLLLTGKSQERWENYLLQHPAIQNWHLDTSETPWTHKWETQSSPKVADLDKQNYIRKDFFKLSKQIPLSEWQDMARFFVTNFQELWDAISYPNV